MSSVYIFAELAIEASKNVMNYKESATSCFGGLSVTFAMLVEGASAITAVMQCFRDSCF